MEFISLLLIALGLAMDAMTVSLGAGTKSGTIRLRSILRLAFHFGLFQGLMTFLGWLGGTTISVYIASFDHWVAFILLCFVGWRMLYEGLGSRENATLGDPTRGSMMVVLSVATSIDALAVGISFAMLKVNILTSSLVIGVVTLILSLLGGLFGRQLGARFGKRMEVLGGFILIGIGVRVLLEHLL